MHIEARLFEILTAFFALATVVYAVLTAYFANGVEWAGTTAMVMTTGLTLIIGTFFRFVARRLDIRPEDYEDAEIADGAGDLGFYSPHSWWPIFVALAAGVLPADATPATAMTAAVTALAAIGTRVCFFIVLLVHAARFGGGRGSLPPAGTGERRVCTSHVRWWPST